MNDWTPIENTDLNTPTTRMIRNLFAAAYPDRTEDFDKWLRKNQFSDWQDGHDTALINGQSKNPYQNVTGSPQTDD